LLEVARQAASNRDFGDVVSGALKGIRSAAPCDGVCIYLESPETREIQVEALDFAGDEGFQKGAPVPRFGTIAAHVLQTGKPWSGSREEACTRFPREMLLAPGFATGCMLPIPGNHRVMGTLGLVRRENNLFSDDEISFLMQ